MPWMIVGVLYLDVHRFSAAAQVYSQGPLGTTSPSARYDARRQSRRRNAGQCTNTRRMARLEASDNQPSFTPPRKQRKSREISSLVFASMAGDDDQVRTSTGTTKSRPYKPRASTATRAGQVVVNRGKRVRRRWGHSGRESLFPAIRKSKPSATKKGQS